MERVNTAQAAGSPLMPPRPRPARLNGAPSPALALSWGVYGRVSFRKRLSPEELRALDEVSRLPPEYPAWMDVLPSDRRPGEERRFEKS